MCTVTNREEDLKAAFGGLVKSLGGLAPVASQLIATHDAYQKSNYDRTIRRMIGYLSTKVDDLEKFLSEEWFRSEEGELYFRKVLASALDVQMEEKQAIFANVLINGVRSDLLIDEKTKFVDMLRQLSLSSVFILAELHTRFEGNTRRPGRREDRIAPFPMVKANDLAEELSKKGFDPYVVISSIKELESVGLFSNVGSFEKQGDGYVSRGGFATELCYTDFSARFAEFLADPPCT